MDIFQKTWENVASSQHSKEYQKIRTDSDFSEDMVKIVTHYKFSEDMGKNGNTLPFTHCRYP